MHKNHEVLDFGVRLWWVDVSWGAVCEPLGFGRDWRCHLVVAARQRARRRIDELASLRDDRAATVAVRRRCRSASRSRAAARRTTSWGCGGHARARPSTLFVGLLPHSRMHHGVGDGPLMNAEQHALRLRASSAGGLTPRLCHTKQGWIWCIQATLLAALLSVVQHLRIYIKSRLKMRAFGKGSWPSWFPQLWIQGLERRRKMIGDGLYLCRSRLCPDRWYNTGERVSLRGYEGSSPEAP